MARITIPIARTAVGGGVMPPRMAGTPGGGPPGPFEGAPTTPAGTGAAGRSTGAAATQTVASAVSGGETAEIRWVAVAYAALLAGFVIGLIANAAWKPVEFHPTSGFDAFALLYAITQSLERLFEPVSSWVRGSAGGETQTKAQATQSRDTAIANALAATSLAGVETEAAKAAKAQARVDQVRRNATVAIWGLQAAAGAALSGALGIFLLRGIGASAVPTWLDMLVTGLAIGGGSKALHELIKSVQVSKEAKQDPAEAGGSS